MFTQLIKFSIALGAATEAFIEGNLSAYYDYLKDASMAFIGIDTNLEGKLFKQALDQSQLLAMVGTTGTQNDIKAAQAVYDLVTGATKAL